MIARLLIAATVLLHYTCAYIPYYATDFRRYSMPPSCFARDLVVDRSSSVAYMACSSGTSLRLVRVNETGAVLDNFLILTDKLAITFALSIDLSPKLRSVFIAGTVSSAIGKDMVQGFDSFVIRVALNGTIIWARTYGSSLQDGTYDLAVDDKNNWVYAAGFYGSSGANSWDQGSGAQYCITQFDTRTGTQNWVKIDGNNPALEFNAWGIGYESTSKHVWTGGQYRYGQFILDRRTSTGSMIRNHTTQTYPDGGIHGPMEYSYELGLLLAPGYLNTAQGRNTAIFLINPITLQVNRTISFGIFGEDLASIVKYLPDHQAFIVCGRTTAAFPGFVYGSGSFGFVFHYIYFNGTHAWTHQIPTTDSNSCTAMDYFRSGRLILTAGYDGVVITNQSYFPAQRASSVVSRTSPASVVITGSSPRAANPILSLFVTNPKETRSGQTMLSGPITDLESQDFPIFALLMAGLAFLLLIICVIMVLLRRKRLMEGLQYSSTATKSTTNLLSAEMMSNATLFGTTLMNSTMVLSIPAFLELKYVEDFQIGSQIAQGGVGTIFLGEVRSAELSARVSTSTIVVKIFGKSFKYLQPQLQRAFEQELSIMHLFGQNEHFVKLFGYCAEPACILMKLYDYGDLDEFIENRGRLSDVYNYSKLVVTNLARQYCAGIAFMHGKGVAHCDVKPKNVLLDLVDNAIVLVITDFGIAQIVESKALKVSAFVVSDLRGASPRYAAPEALRNLRIRKRFADPAMWKKCDTYSLSMVLFALLTRTNPWEFK